MTERPQAVHYRVYLLAYDLDKGDLYDRTRTAFLTRAGVLAQLALGGHVVERDGEVSSAKLGATGDPALDEALGQIAEHPRSWGALLKHDYKQTLDTTERQLGAIGIVTVDEKKVLGLLPRTHVTVTDQSLVKELQIEAADILHGTGPASDVDPADAAVVVLAAAGLVPSVSRKETRDHKARIEELTTRLGDAVPGLDKALRGIRMTMIAAQGGMGGS